MSHTLELAINTNVRPLANGIETKINFLSTSNAENTKDIINLVKSCHNIASLESNTRGLEIQEIRNTLHSRLDTTIKVQKEGHSHIAQSLDMLKSQNTKLQGDIDEISKQQIKATDLVLRKLSSSEEAIQQNISAEQYGSSKLHHKLVQVDTSIQAIQGSLQVLSHVGQHRISKVSDTGIEKALQGILGSIWLLVSSLQVLIREILYGPTKPISLIANFPRCTTRSLSSFTLSRVSPNVHAPRGKILV